MSTPAAAALSDAGSTAAPGAAAPAPGTAAPAPAANPNAFWNSWNLPDQKDTRDWVANKNYENPFVLAKSARDWETQAATLRAGKGYPVPGADGKVDPNAQKAWNALTGVPETPDKYNLTPDAVFPEFTNFMARGMLDAGVPAEMAKRLNAVYNEAQELTMKAQDEALRQKSVLALAELERAWGSNYQERIAFGARGKEWMAKEVGGISTEQWNLMESVFGTDKVMTMMWKLGAGNAESRFAGDNLTSGRGFTGGASEAQARLDQLTADRSSGKISELQWKDIAKPGGEYDQLRDRIVNGMAAQH